MKRLTIKQQTAIARKSKSKQELPEPEELPEPSPEESKRDRQVNVKFSANDLVKLKKAAASSHRPVANYI